MSLNTNFLTGLALPSGFGTLTAQANAITFVTGLDKAIYFSQLTLRQNALPQDMVDTILIQASGGYAARNRIATLDVSGAGNTQPTANGSGYKSFLTSVGWTVLTN